ncbi:hypothetical protein, partial [Vibrio sp. Y159]|uniref:hypothetical protein n=1 Tax=Vibrio sp. Y159 TaxID=3074703 RepID=UPI00296448B4
KKLTKQRKFTPWYNSQTRKLKQISQKFERNWQLTKLQESRLIWTDSLKRGASAMPEQTITQH